MNTSRIIEAMYARSLEQVTGMAYREPDLREGLIDAEPEETPRWEGTFVASRHKTQLSQEQSEAWISWCWALLNKARASDAKEEMIEQFGGEVDPRPELVETAKSINLPVDEGMLIKFGSAAPVWFINSIRETAQELAIAARDNNPLVTMSLPVPYDARLGDKWLNRPDFEDDGKPEYPGTLSDKPLADEPEPEQPYGDLWDDDPQAESTNPEDFESADEFSF